MRLLTPLIAAFAAASLAHLFDARPAYGQGQEASPALEVVNVTANPTPGGRLITAAYMTVHNPSAHEDRLISASSPLAARVEVHLTSRAADGMMRMEHQADGVVIPAGADVLFQRGGLHLMAMELAGPLAPGDELPLTLMFERAGAVSVTAAVVRPGERPTSPPGGR